jgi:hypothetical protein
MLRVRERHSRTINLEDKSSKRLSLVAEEVSLGPRSAWLKELPCVDEGDELVFIPLPDAGTIVFDPAIKPGMPHSRWRPLWREWVFLTRDLELPLPGEPESVEEIAAMLGLGPGHTPAGDDWITGWIVALKWCGTQETDILLESFSGLFRKGVTTWLSESIISDALEGKTWISSLRLIEALQGNSWREVRDAVGTLLQWGHSSGGAWLAGFASGLEKALSRKEVSV